MCVLECVRTAECRSFNFCWSYICEFNKEDVFSIGINNQHTLKNDNDCIYYGMHRDYTPLCQERGYSKNIDDDENPGACQINWKRVDRKWFSWEFRSNSSAAEIFEYKWRELLVDIAHGGLTGAGAATEMLQRLKVVSEKKDFKKAQGLRGTILPKFGPNGKVCVNWSLLKLFK